MKLVSNGIKGNFKLFHKEEEICEVIYTNWLKGSACTLVDGHKLELTPANLWTRKVKILKEHQLIGDISYNPKGFMTINLFRRDQTPHSFYLKNSGIWKFKMELFDSDGHCILIMSSENKWTKLNYDFHIDILNSNLTINYNELVIYCGYAANLYLKMISAV